MNQKNYLTIDQIDAYVIAFKLSNEIWKIVMRWDKMAQWTVGKQYITAADSISANIAEGFGRFHKKDMKSLEEFPKAINQLIKYTNEKLKY